MPPALRRRLPSPGPVEDVAAEEPYPLWRQYPGRIVPGLLLFVAGLVTLAAIGIDEMIDGIYLELAEARADTIASLLEREAPEGWRDLLSGRPPAEVWAGAELRGSTKEGGDEVGEWPRNRRSSPVQPQLSCSPTLSSTISRITEKVA